MTKQFAMKCGTRCLFLFIGVVFLISGWSKAVALEGAVRMHDPSTVIVCDGRYYVFSTGPGIPIFSSDDGWTWERSGQVFEHVPDSVHAAVPLNDGRLVWAPDIIRLNGEYYLYYSISSWGSNVSAVGLMTSPTLNAKDPRYHWTDRGLVVNSVKGENLNAIDPGVLEAPDRTLWLTYGSFIGNVQLLQLNPKTGLRIAKNSPATIVSSQSEASELIYRRGYYYLFVNRGSCCQGFKSTYNIRVGRSRKATGPYLDPWDEDMAHGGGALFLAAQGNHIGPGHFGVLRVDGVERFSCHYEADLSRASGKPGERPWSVLDIRPLLWSQDGWPVAGDNPSAGTYQIRSQRTGLNLQLATGISQDRYTVLDTQKWMLTPAGKYYKLTNGSGNNSLQASASPSGGLIAAPSTGADDELWLIDQLSDGTYRIQSKTGGAALTAELGADNNKVELAPFTDKATQHWVITTP